MLSQVPASEMGYLEKDHVTTLPRDKVRSYYVPKALNLEPLVQLEKSQL